jgi:hypothetical protein
MTTQIPNPTFSPLLGLDVDITTGDIQFSTAGDIAMVGGEALLYQRFYCALIADGVLMAPTFGAGLGRYLDAPYDASNRAAIVERVTTVVGQDPAVEYVQNVTLSVTRPNEVTTAWRR